MTGTSCSKAQEVRFWKRSPWAEGCRLRAVGMPPSSRAAVLTLAFLGAEKQSDSPKVGSG